MSANRKKKTVDLTSTRIRIMDYNIVINNSMRSDPTPPEKNKS